METKGVRITLAPMVRRWSLSLLLLAFGLLPAGKAAAVIGGVPVTSSAEAPWSVKLDMSRPGTQPGTELRGECSGSIISPTQVLTAGHCAGAEGIPWDRWIVRAGISRLSPLGAPTEQVSEVTAVSTPALYISDTYVRDVALLEVDPPFDLSTGSVESISLAEPGTDPPGSLSYYGWGDIAPGVTSAEERRLDLTSMPEWRCPSHFQGLPSFACMQPTDGGVCPGDSGSGVVGGNPPRLFATISVTPSEYAPCTAGVVVGGSDLTSPAINAFLRGTPIVSKAPEARRVPRLRGRARAGRTVTCESAGWSPPGTGLLTAFVVPSSGRVLQEGNSRNFEIPPWLPGRQIACVSIAVDEGGRTEIRSTNDPRVRGA